MSLSRGNVHKFDTPPYVARYASHHAREKGSFHNVGVLMRGTTDCNWCHEQEQTVPAVFRRSPSWTVGTSSTPAAATTAATP